MVLGAFLVLHRSNFAALAESGESFIWVNQFETAARAGFSRLLGGFVENTAKYM